MKVLRCKSFLLILECLFLQLSIPNHLKVKKKLSKMEKKNSKKNFNNIINFLNFTFLKFHLYCEGKYQINMKIFPTKSLKSFCYAFNSILSIHFIIYNSKVHKEFPLANEIINIKKILSHKCNRNMSHMLHVYDWSNFRNI